MALHPEERRIAGLLRELIVQSGMPLEMLETGLEWDSGRLSSLLEGRQKLTFDDVLEILPLLGTTPTDFFAWLYGFDPRDSGATAAEGLWPEPSVSGSPSRQALERRFEQSVRVVRDAITRRRVWKEERSQT
ncbi:MAG TPA: hypothetical protein VKK31_26490 [Thermoanaerobaculia bacterium]|nr:hypothetical protein [Thermoanaerobaculia bacterium]